MARNTDIFHTPSDQSVGIWRYLDFTKFAAMLEVAGIFFSRADLLGDPFEGSYSKANEKIRSETYKDLLPEGFDVDKLSITFSAFSKWVRQWIYISCWHINNHESASMWKLYTKSNEAVAIKSKFVSLKNLLPGNVHFGKVRYVDYKREWMPEGNFLYPFVHKRKSFEHENELRAIILD